MGIAAVLSYLQTALDGQILGGLAVVEAHTIPMPVLRNGMAEPLRLYIWPSRILITQPTMSGPAGYRREGHRPVLMALRQTVNQAVSVAQFPALVDGLLSILMTLGANIPLDGDGNVVPVPQAVSYLTVGALDQQAVQFDVAFRYPRMTLDQRPVTLVCEIGVMAYEQVTP